MNEEYLDVDVCLRFKKQQALITTMLTYIANFLVILAQFALELPLTTFIVAAVAVNLTISAAMLTYIIGNWLTNRRLATAARLVDNDENDLHAAVNTVKNGVLTWGAITGTSLLFSLITIALGSANVYIVLLAISILITIAVALTTY